MRDRAELKVRKEENKVTRDKKRIVEGGLLKNVISKYTISRVTAFTVSEKWYIVVE